MMSALMEALQKHLVTELAAGLGLGTQISPETAPDEWSRPYIVMSIVSSTHYRSTEGTCGLRDIIIQLTIVSDTTSNADAISEAVREELNGFTGTLGSGGVTIVVQDCGLVSQASDVSNPRGGTDKPKHMRHMDWTFTHAETIP